LIKVFDEKPETEFLESWIKSGGSLLENINENEFKQHFVNSAILCLRGSKNKYIEI
jgi:hypothetical protein